jgi:hypothetical protein
MTNPVQIISRTTFEFIRLHPEMYLPAGGMPLATKLAELLVIDALALGVDDVRIVRSGEWYAVAADRDWLRLGGSSSDIPDLFLYLRAFPEAGVNSVRHEAVVSAFSSDVLTSIDGEAFVINSADDEKALAVGLELCRRCAPWRVVAFRCME